MARLTVFVMEMDMMMTRPGSERCCAGSGRPFGRATL
jgi:hypothetical protein